MAEHLARRHGVRLRSAPLVHSVDTVWTWLHWASNSDSQFLLIGGGGGSAIAPKGEATDLRIVTGAISCLRDILRRASRPSQCIVEKAGDWEVSKIFTRWPPQIATELARFNWPLTSSAEVAALVDCEHASPTALMAFEFTSALRGAYEHHLRYYQQVALSVDLRSSLVPGPHACMHARTIMGVKIWRDAFLHPTLYPPSVE